jgi:hypothetical protein
MASEQQSRSNFTDRRFPTAVRCFAVFYARLLRSQVFFLTAKRNRRDDSRFAMDTMGLPAGAAFKPIQIQDSMGGVPQPSADFSYLKRPVLRVEVAIHQFGYFLSGARLLDLVQRSS